MSFIYDFADNKSISSSELNSIVTELGEGVTLPALFEDNTSYAVSRLNLIRGEIFCGGVLSGLECQVADGNATIGCGVCFFDNGMRLEITEPETLPLPSAETCYVYMYASPLQTAALPVICSDARNGTDYIPVAEISEGVVTDCRVFCQAKIPLKASSRYIQEENDVYLSVTAGLSDYTAAHEIPLKNKGFSKIFIYKATSQNVDSIGLYDRETQTFISLLTNTAYPALNKGDDFMYAHNNNASYMKIKFRVSGENLQVLCQSYSHAGSPITNCIMNFIII